MPIAEELNLKPQEVSSTNQNISPINGAKGKLNKKTLKKKIN